MAAWSQNGPALQPRPPAIKPAQTTVDDKHDPRVITVKFRDGLTIREREGRLTDLGTGDLGPARELLESLAGGRWRRVDSLPETKIEEMRQAAQANLGRPIADLNLQFYFLLPKGTNVAGVIDAFNTLNIVEMAQPIQRRAELPIPPDLIPMQGYLGPPTAGVNAFASWAACGQRGIGIKMADVEVAYYVNHIDLQPVTFLGGDMTWPIQNYFQAIDHGSASLGVVGSRDNGFGTIGIAPDCALLFSAVYQTMYDLDTLELLPFVDIPGAVMTAIGGLGAGDVMLLELEANGPLGYAPIEWEKPVYDRIVLANGLGIVVVEAAGNGGNSLDNPLYSTGNGGHWPFLPANDSGAIIVGAGAAPAGFGGTTTEHSRLTFSNYGTTVDLQGWGERVVTTGYGDAYGLEGPDSFFASGWGGTSAASPVVAGACVLIQSTYKARTSSVLTAAQIKQALQTTGTPQQAGLHPVSQRIGPFPNVKAAISQLLPCQLTITQLGGGLVSVTWKACGVLEGTPRLGHNTDWQVIQTEGNSYTFFHNQASEGAPKFFRLQCP